MGGGWAAYQVQTAVSIDQVPLLVLHLALAGAVLATAGSAALREIRLPGALQPVVPHRNDAKAKRRAAVAAPHTRPVTGSDLAVLSLLALVALVATWQSFTPLRANVAVQNGGSLARQGDGAGAFHAYHRATGLLPGQALYWGKKGALFQGASPPQTSQALAAYRQAAEADPYDVNALKAAAAVAEEEGSLDLSRELYTRAVEVDPLNPETLVAAATVELRHGGPRRLACWSVPWSACRPRRALGHAGRRPCGAR